MDDETIGVKHLNPRQGITTYHSREALLKVNDDV